jgi:hypothetical protein
VLDHDCRLDRVGERTLVEVAVTNETAVDRRVRVENRLDGPVEPPREGGSPAPGWDDDGYTGVVPADDRLTLGYACRAPPTEPAVAVHDEGRPDDERDETTAADAARLLGDGAPPADAVPVEGDGVTSDDPPAPVAAMAETLDGPSDGSPDGAAEPSTPVEVRDDPVDRDADDPTVTDPASSAPTDDDPDLPPAVETWLDDAAGRVDDAETLATGDLAAVARVAEARGGAEGAVALADALAADERALRALAARAERLADRAADAAVPVEALRSLS